MIKKIVIANRGEIAVRVIRSCREMGISPVALFSEADRLSRHVMLADEAYCIGGAASKESYLNIDRIIRVALACGADAVHPGYGFLSENADFARRCAEAGLVFIGPRPETIDAMGDKISARRKMIEAGVPVVPGTQENLSGADEAVEACRRIGFPVMLKASQGGGGKGMRLARSEDEVREAFVAARSEAVASFGDGTIYIERFVEEPHHIEFQILGDTHGNVIHLCDRECSVQRRHQKIVEESPSPFLTPELRERMGADAVAAARAVGYVGAGTIEFLVDKHRNYYFLEMNTRLQVEHPITEEVTGVDLVREQIRIAAGEPLSLAQPDIVQRGHAIECRVCAEDAAAGFMPSPGPVRQLSEPGGPGVRIDGYVYEGYDIPIHYDPMISKLIVHAETRERAIARMRRALDEYRITGVKTNIGYLSSILGVPDFERGSYDTSFLEKNAVLLGSAAPQQDERTEDLAMIVAYMNYIVDTESGAGATAATAGDQTSRWREFGKRKGGMGMENEKGKKYGSTDSRPHGRSRADRKERQRHPALRRRQSVRSGHGDDRPGHLLGALRRTVVRYGSRAPRGRQELHGQQSLRLLRGQHRRRAGQVPAQPPARRHPAGQRPVRPHAGQGGARDGAAW